MDSDDVQHAAAEVEPLEAPEPTGPDLQAAFIAVRDGYAAEPMPTLAQRKAWLNRLLAMVRDNQVRICEAVARDFGTRSPVETLGAELMVVITGIQHLLAHLGGWMEPERRQTGALFAPAWSEVRYQPKGVVGVISPWNYPVHLALTPIATAFAAGNRVLLKPSELSPATSALLQELLHGAFPKDLIQVVTGGPEVGQAFASLPLNHIVFTGSTAVGRHVMRAAAENLTPVTLELGGKSPAIVHRKADLKHAVQRIVFAKVLNAGQTCIAVDYAMVPRELEGRFVELVNAQLDAFLGGRVADNPDFTSIITDRHRARLEQLVADAVAKGARITRYGSDDPASAGKVAPTILQGVDDTMDVMREEIFGPLLPVVPYDTLEQALAWVNARPRPLALYYFDRDERRIDQVLTGTHAGGVCVNDTLLHGAQEDIPFGGVGESGMGAYHGREGFLSLSHAKAVFHQRRIRLTWLFNPPYGQAVRTILKAVVG